MKIELDDMQASAGEAEELLKALANRHRLMILCQLIGGERSVGELAAFLELRDSTVSQHLALLRKDGLVSTRREGQTIWYAIASEPARQIVETLYQVFCAPGRFCVPGARTKKRM
jgi:ArsR family transcriptional regulator, virulence genes transcriptional regulator